MHVSLYAPGVQHLLLLGLLEPGGVVFFFTNLHLTFSLSVYRSLR